MREVIEDCLFYNRVEYIPNENGYTQFPDYCSCYNNNCFNHPNCYYRQVYRLHAIIGKSCKHFAPGGECSLDGNNCPGTASCIERGGKWKEN